MNAYASCVCIVSPGVIKGHKTVSIKPDQSIIKHTRPVILNLPNAEEFNTVPHVVVILKHKINFITLILLLL